MGRTVADELARKLEGSIRNLVRVSKCLISLGSSRPLMTT